MNITKRENINLKNTNKGLSRNLILKDRILKENTKRIEVLEDKEIEIEYLRKFLSKEDYKRIVEKIENKQSCTR